MEDAENVAVIVGLAPTSPAGVFDAPTGSLGAAGGAGGDVRTNAVKLFVPSDTPVVVEALDR